MTMATEKPRGVDPQIAGLLGELTPSLNGKEKVKVAPRLISHTYADFSYEPVEWLVKYWFPKVGVVGIAGKEGDGKSTLLSWLAAGIQLGTFPNLDPCDVALMTTEGNRARHCASLIFAGGKKEKLISWTIEEISTITGKAQESTAYFHKHFASIEEDVQRRIVEGTPLGAIFLDPANQLLGLDTSSSGSDYAPTRDRIKYLEDFAIEYNVLIILVKHIKSNAKYGDDMNSAVYGTRAWVETLRYLHQLRRITDTMRTDLPLAPDDNVTHLLIRSKNSESSPSTPSEAFRLEEGAVELPIRPGSTEVKSHEVVRLVHIGQRDIIGADIEQTNGLSAKEKSDENNKRTKTEQWLIDTLNAAPNGRQTRPVMEDLFKEAVKRIDGIATNFKSVERAYKKFNRPKECADNSNIVVWSLPDDLVETGRQAGSDHPRGGPAAALLARLSDTM